MKHQAEDARRQATRHPKIHPPTFKPGGNPGFGTSEVAESIPHLPLFVAFKPKCIYSG